MRATLSKFWKFASKLAIKKAIPASFLASTIFLGYEWSRDNRALTQNEEQEMAHQEVGGGAGGGEQASENDLITPTSQLFISQESAQEKKLFIFSGSGNRELAKEIVSHLDVQLNRISIHKNSQKELEIQILDTVRGQHVFVIQSMSIPNVNDSIIELYLMCSALKRSGARKITCIIPYFPYSRQTSFEKERKRRSLAGSDICTMLESMGCDEVVTINYSQQEIKGFFTGRVPLLNIDVNEMAVPYFLSKQIENPLLISAHLRQRNIQRLVGLEKLFGFFDHNSSIGFLIKGDSDNYQFIGESVKDRDCILLDTLVDSGKSLSEMALKLHKDGARRIFWFSPHGLFTDTSQKLIKNSYIEECIVTNTVEEVKPQNPKIRYLSIAKTLSEVISVLHAGKSLEKFRKSKQLDQYSSSKNPAKESDKSFHIPPTNYNRSSNTFHL